MLLRYKILGTTAIVAITCGALAICFRSSIVWPLLSEVIGPTNEAGSGADLAPVVPRPGPVVGLGDVPCRSNPTFRFEIENRSSSTVKLLELSKSCGCTDVNVSSDVLRAGSAIEVIGKVRTQPRPGHYEVGLNFLFGIDGQPAPHPLAVQLEYNAYSVVTLSHSHVLLRPDPAMSYDGVQEVEFTNESEHAISVELHCDLTCVCIHPDTFSLNRHESESVKFQAGPECVAGVGQVKMQFSSSEVSYEIMTDLRITPKPRVVVTPRVLYIASEGELTGGGVTFESGTLDKLRAEVLSVPEGVSVNFEDRVSVGRAMLYVEVDLSQAAASASRLEVAVGPEDGSWVESLSIPILRSVATTGKSSSE